MLSQVRRVTMTPLWIAQLATGTKSFERNLVIGSRRLNEWGLHAARVTLAHRLATARRKKLAGLITARDRSAFDRDGFIVHPKFLPAEQFAALTLREAFAEVPVEKARTWVGVAGTVTTLSALVQRLPVYDSERTHLSRLSLEQVRASTEDLLGSTHQQRAATPAIHPGRVDVIAGGALIVRVVAEELHSKAGITELVVSEHDILDGIVFGLG